VSTYLSVVTPTSNLVGVGGAWVIEVAATTELGDLSSAVVPVAAVTDPSGTVTAPVPTTPSTGLFVLALVPSVLGRWLVHLSTPEDALDVAAHVQGPTTAAGMPNVDDAITYLADSSTSWSRATVTDAFNAERSAQRDRCGERAVYPDSLRQALLRRVSRNLAMRRLPLAVNFGDADAGSTILPGRDPEVRRLEGPYRRMAIG
jgi:hypothetical protein